MNKERLDNSKTSRRTLLKGLAGAAVVGAVTACTPNTSAAPKTPVVSVEQVAPAPEPMPTVMLTPDSLPAVEVTNSARYNAVHAPNVEAATMAKADFLASDYAKNLNTTGIQGGVSIIRGKIIETSDGDNVVTYENPLYGGSLNILSGEEQSGGYFEGAAFSSVSFDENGVISLVTRIYNSAIHSLEPAGADVLQEGNEIRVANGDQLVAFLPGNGPMIADAAGNALPIGVQS